MGLGTGLVFGAIIWTLICWVLVKKHALRVAKKVIGSEEIEKKIMEMTLHAKLEAERRSREINGECKRITNE
jgi:hypothetical protein